MDEIYTLSQYFPLSSSDPTLEKYLDHHLGACLKCSENELYSSAYSHLHILYMIFVYVQLLRIAKEKVWKVPQKFDTFSMHSYNVNI
jgi:hypothetical protein